MSSLMVAPVVDEASSQLPVTASMSPGALSRLISQPHEGKRCDQDPDRFVPFKSEEHLYTELCDGCPLRFFCCEWACQTGSEGIWGGTTTAERKKIVAERRKSGWRKPR